MESKQIKSSGIRHMESFSQLAEHYVINGNDESRLPIYILGMKQNRISSKRNYLYVTIKFEVRVYVGIMYFNTNICVCADFNNLD